MDWNLPVVVLVPQFRDRRRGTLFFDRSRLRRQVQRLLEKQFAWHLQVILVSAMDLSGLGLAGEAKASHYGRHRDSKDDSEPGEPSHAASLRLNLWGRSAKD